MLVLNDTVKVTKNKTGLDPIVGTGRLSISRVGTINASYNELQAVFGKPTNDEKSGDGKVLFEWNFIAKSKGDMLQNKIYPINIYLYKPEKDPRKNPNQVHNWSIASISDCGLECEIIVKDYLHRRPYSDIYGNLILHIYRNPLIEKVSSDSVDNYDKLKPELVEWISKSAIFMLERK